MGARDGETTVVDAAAGASGRRGDARATTTDDAFDVERAVRASSRRRDGDDAERAALLGETRGRRRGGSRRRWSAVSIGACAAAVLGSACGAIAWRRGAAGARASALGNAGAATTRPVKPMKEMPTGVALNGWLHLEEWFFANGESTVVDSPIGASQGRVLPPFFNTPAELGFSWSSEGDLVAKLARKYGNLKTAKIMNAYRSSWLTNEDLRRISQLGLESVRVPVTWAAFMGTQRDPTRIIQDPKYGDRAFATVDQMAMTHVLRVLHRETGAKVVMDMHSMPGGSSQGTYNGVFPHPPAFWDDPKLQDIGMQAIHKMLKWYNALREEDKRFIDGFTLLNEPAHLMPAKREAMLEWMGKAIYVYKQLIVRPCEMMKKPVPKLYVNLMETSGIQTNEFSKIMRKWFDLAELRTWAVLDTHFYLAWGVNGCDKGCAWKCSDTPQRITETVRSTLAQYIHKVQAPAALNGVKLFSVSEWSIATNHDSSKGCASEDVRRAVYKGQLRAFNVTRTPNFFWGWKMPNAGNAHEDFWSLQHFHGQLGAFQDLDIEDERPNPSDTIEEGTLTALKEELKSLRDEVKELRGRKTTTNSTKTASEPSFAKRSGAKRESQLGAASMVAQIVTPAIAPSLVNFSVNVSNTGADLTTQANPSNSSGSLGWETAPWVKHEQTPQDLSGSHSQGQAQPSQARGPKAQSTQAQTVMSEASNDDDIIQGFLQSSPEGSDAPRRVHHKQVVAQPQSQQRETFTEPQPQQRETFAEPQPQQRQVFAESQPQQRQVVAQPQPQQRQVVAQPQPQQRQVVAQPQPQQRQVVAQPQQQQRQVVAQPQQPAASSQGGVLNNSRFAPAAQATAAPIGRLAPAAQASKAATTQPGAQPIVYAKDRHDGSFWGTSFGLDALKAPEIHENALLQSDDEEVDESQYYEEPREEIAARTGTKLPTYADDAVDNIHQHRSTYSMHEAKSLKNKVSYDLFSSKKLSKKHAEDDDDSSTTPSKVKKSTHKRGSSTERVVDDAGDDLDFNKLMSSQDFGGGSSSTKSSHKFYDEFSDGESVELAPEKLKGKRKSKKSRKPVDDDDDDDDDNAEEGEETSSSGSSKFSRESIEKSLEKEASGGEKISKDEGVPDWISFG